MGRGSTFGQVEQEVASFSKGPVWGLSRMWFAVQLEYMFYGLFSENVGYCDLKKTKNIRINYLSVLSVSMARKGALNKTILSPPLFILNYS